MSARALPSFDLVLATVGRIDVLAAFLDSLDRQRGVTTRVLVVDQSGGDGVTGLLAGRESTSTLHLRSERGLSRARNAALPLLEADLVGFPDDDCLYPEGLLERVARRFAGDPGLHGLSGRHVTPDGRVAENWATSARAVTQDTVWHTLRSSSIFLRREAVREIGAFDERLGLGGTGTWTSAEEVEYVLRGVLRGLRVEYDPSLEVVHPAPVLAAEEHVARGLRDGASVGYILRLHHAPARLVARMAVRPLGGIARGLARRDRAEARYYAETLRGRVLGYLRQPRA